MRTLIGMICTATSRALAAKTMHEIIFVTNCRQGAAGRLESVGESLQEDYSSTRTSRIVHSIHPPPGRPLRRTMADMLCASRSGKGLVLEITIAAPTQFIIRDYLFAVGNIRVACQGWPDDSSCHRPSTFESCTKPRSNRVDPGCAELPRGNKLA